MTLTIEAPKLQKRWVLWRLEKRDGKDTKVPYQVNGAKAASNRPETCATYAEISAGAVGFSGVGVVLGEVDGIHVSGVDIDNCCDAFTGKFTSESREIVIGLDSYALAWTAMRSTAQAGLAATFLCLAHYTSFYMLLNLGVQFLPFAAANNLSADVAAALKQSHHGGLIFATGAPDAASTGERIAPTVESASLVAGKFCANFVLPKPHSLPSIPLYFL